MINENNRTETRRANGIDYIYEYLEDGWVAIYEFHDGLPWKPLTQACNEEKADEFIVFREPVPSGVQRLV